MKWNDLPFFDSERYLQLCSTLEEQYLSGVVIHPEPEEMLLALELTPLDKVKVVILGQDPYPTPGNANGLAFSVHSGVKMPASLANINEELKSDLGCPGLTDGNLEHWAKQGVLLLNTSLSVASGSPGSHSKIGWSILTNQIIKTVNEQPRRVVFLLWGKHAQSKAVYINKKKHLVLNAPHPSPLSAHKGFFGCKHFSKTNKCLAEQGRKICWCGLDTCHHGRDNP